MNYIKMIKFQLENKKRMEDFEKNPDKYIQHIIDSKINKIQTKQELL